jgi:hypothetical protein
LFVKSIFTVPAFAVSEVFVYLSCPEGSASTLSAEEAAELDELDGPEDVLAGALGVVAGVLELLEELPHPASTPASASAASGSEDLRASRALDVAPVEIKGSSDRRDRRRCKTPRADLPFARGARRMQGHDNPRRGVTHRAPGAVTKSAAAALRGLASRSAAG